MSHYPELLLSNRLEMLAEQLGLRLFSESSRPFDRRVVVVPHEQMKGFLLHYFARHPRYQVAMGMHLLTLQESFTALFEWIGSRAPHRVPSFLELSLQLEALISTLLEQEDDPTIEPLSTYLQGGSTRRLGALCDQLSRVFSRYGLYGGSFLEEWKKKNGWQQTLWRRLFAPRSLWTYPLEAFSGKFSCGFQLHLFAFNFLPPVYVSFFEQLNAVFYHLSPCADFWQELRSEKEEIKKQRTGALSHPLLANWGKLGREALKALDHERISVEESYIEPQASTLLAAVQRDLLRLQLTPSRIEEKEPSIQLHIVSSKLREIEILCDALLNFLDQNEFSPSDLLILAPDISLYAPLIHMVFRGGKIPYAIHGLPGTDRSDLILAWTHLFSLPRSRFSKESVMQLFAFRSFCEGVGFSKEEVARCALWVEKAEVRWGWDREEKMQVTGNQDVAETGSWVDGIDRLLWGLGFLPQEGRDLPVWPCPVVDLSEIDLLEKFLLFLHQLHADLQELMKEKKRSLAGWMELCLRLISRYFGKEGEADPFVLQFKRLFQSLQSVDEECFTYESMERILEHLAHSSHTSFSSAEVHRVTFASFDENPVQPARLVWCLGMDEISFPRSERKSTLAECKTGYFPSRLDADRHLFLQHLSLARDYFIISYERVHPDDQKEQGPSLLVDELKTLLRETYGVAPDKWVFSHPALPIDPSCFLETAPIRSYHPIHFAASESLRKPPRPLSPFSVRGEMEPLTLFEVKKIQAFARHPIKSYLQEGLGIYFPFEEEKEEAEFVLPSYLKAALRKEAIRGSLSSSLAAWQQQGVLPEGIYRSIATTDVERETEELLEHFSRAEISLEECFSVELSPSCRIAQLQEKGRWILPALKVEMPDGRQVEIIGKMEHLFPQGIWVEGKGGYADAVKAWPLFLLFLSLPLVNEGKEKGVLWTKSGKFRTGVPENPSRLLGHYLAYYEGALKTPSLLMPDWAEDFLAGNLKQMQRHLATCGEGALGYPDRALQFMKRREAFLPLETIWQCWQEPLSLCFQPMIDLWLTKEAAHAEI